MIALNFGCGTNKLPGWQNFDAEIDISMPLPFADGHADYILAEHVVEHIPYGSALAFFRECHRVLKPGGIARIAVPSIEQLLKLGTPEYFEFVHARGWAQSRDARGAMQAMLDCHGHKAPWTEALLSASLYVSGFDHTCHCSPGVSSRPILSGVEGHGRVIGDAFNGIETVVCEATK